MRNNREDALRSTLICAGIFVIFLLFFEAALVDGGENFRTLSRIYFRDGILKFFIASLALVISIAITTLFLVAAFSAPKFLKPIYLIAFVLLLAIEYSVFRAFGFYSTPHLAEIAFWAADWRVIRDAVGMYLNLWSLVPIVLFTGCLLVTRSHKRLNGYALLALVTISAGFFFLTTYFTSNQYPAVSLSAGVRTVVSYPTIWLVGTARLDPKNPYYATEREQVAVMTHSKPANNVVFIMDESVRGDYLSINGYGLQTTPALERLSVAGHIRNWGIASSGTTCSATSNNLILTGVTDLPDRSFEVYRRPTIFQYAKAMNYRTHLIDAQASTVWLGKPSDFKFVDEWVHASDLMGSSSELYNVDGLAADKVSDIVRNSTGNFIWITKFGVHGPYTTSYPEAGTSVEQVLDLTGVELDPLKEAYVKAIHYNSEVFFGTLFADGPAPDTYYLYTSDHGQTLGEGEFKASHCIAARPAAMVPLLLVANKEQIPDGDATYLASHANIFPTLLDLLGVPQHERRNASAISLLSAGGQDSMPRYFFSGDINRDEGFHPFDP